MLALLKTFVRFWLLGAALALTGVVLLFLLAGGFR